MIAKMGTSARDGAALTKNPSVCYLLPAATPPRESDMAKGPRGEKRPADVIGGAVMVARIATGEIEDTREEKSGRVRSGHAGARARAEKLTAEERSEVARKAATARWG